jgi:RNA polymerase nonessential primary-like sigma factor
MTTENDLKVSNSYHSRRREAIMSAINPSTLETEFISPSFSILKLKENSIDLDEDFLGSDLEDDLVS